MKYNIQILLEHKNDIIRNIEILSHKSKEKSNTIDIIYSIGKMPKEASEVMLKIEKKIQHYNKYVNEQFHEENDSEH